MAYFTISYDLVADKDYESLINRLEALDAVKTQLSYWLLELDNTAEQVKSDLASYMDDDDKLMVIEFSKKPAWTKGFKGTSAWINSRF